MLVISEKGIRKRKMGDGCMSRIIGYDVNMMLIFQFGVLSGGGRKCWINKYQQYQYNSSIRQGNRNMSEVKDSRVEFFNSESSFGSSSNISTSRIDFQCDELMLNAENIFQTLRTTLKPRSDLTSLEDIKHIVYRAKLLANDSIPICIARLGKNNRKAYIQDLNQSSRKLEKLMADHANLTDDAITYEQFYNMYGDFGMFNKKVSNRLENASLKVGNRPVSPNFIIPEPDVVNIVNIESSRAKATNSGKLRGTANPQRNQNDQKEIEKLHQEIMTLNKSLRQKEWDKEQFEQQLRTTTNKRILNLIKLSQGANEKLLSGLEEQVKILKQAYQKQVNTNKGYKDRIIASERQNQNLLEQIKGLREQLVNNQRLNTSQVSEKSNWKSYEGGDSQLNDSNTQKLEKINKNLEYENFVLKNELQKQREVLFKINKKQEKRQENDLEKLQQKNNLKTKQISQLTTELDRYRIENIRLVDRLQKTEKSVELVKLQATNAKSYVESQKTQIPGKSNGFKDNNRLDQSRSSKSSRAIVHVQEYIGDGNQQYPYYEFLNKEFRIRFRRACLKDKQLLYKASGLELGIITQYIKPNQLKQCLYLSNFCDKQVIKNLKFKLTNSKNNRTHLETTSYDKLEIGEQIKNYLTCSLAHYPIGCTVLICQYDYYTKHEEIRVLLPINVFKMLSIKARDSDFDEKNSKRDSFAVERKIAKDFDAILGYFKGGRVIKNEIQCTIHHEHTNTRFLYDLVYTDGQLQVKFEHKFGDANLSEYIVKSISFLLKKEQGV